MALINIGTTPNDGTGDDLRTAFEKVNLSTIENAVIVKSVDDFFPIQNDKPYLIDGSIDFGNTALVYTGKLTIIGLDFENSRLFSSEPNHVMFQSAASGNLQLRNLEISCSGTGSRVFELVANNGFESIEIVSVNFIECSSLGFFDGFRQGFESQTGRFSFDPQLEFRNNWIGGYVVKDSILRNNDGNLPTIFKAGTGLVFNSRFRLTINADLDVNSSLFDFSPANFATDNLLQVDSSIVTKAGVSDPDDATIYPNINEKDIKSKWKNNLGLPNTNKGGTLTITSTALTSLTQNVWANLAGTFTLTKAQHIDEPANGQLRNIDSDSVDYILLASITLIGVANNIIEVRPSIFRAATNTFEPQESSNLFINSNVGANDVGILTFFDQIKLKSNDYVKLEVRNITSGGNVTAQINSKFKLYAE